MLNTTYFTAFNPIMSNGEFTCSCCRQPITIERSVPFTYESGSTRPSYMVVGDVQDDEGYHWRSFCKDCISKVEELDEAEIVEKYPETLNLA